MMWTDAQLNSFNARGQKAEYESTHFVSEKSITVLMSTLKKLGPTATVSKLCKLLRIEESDAKSLLRSAKRRMKSFKQRAKEISRRKEK